MSNNKYVVFAYYGDDESPRTVKEKKCSEERDCIGVLIMVTILESVKYFSLQVGRLVVMVNNAAEEVLCYTLTVIHQ
jgi:hypothetical protein